MYRWAQTQTEYFQRCPSNNTLKRVKDIVHWFYTLNSVYSSQGVLLSLWKPFHNVFCGSGGSSPKSERITVMIRAISAWPWRLQIYNREPHRNWMCGDGETGVFTRQRPLSNKWCYQVALCEIGYSTRFSSLSFFHSFCLKKIPFLSFPDIPLPRTTTASCI